MFDLHMHSTYSDGKNTPEEMIRAAIDLGLDCVGISDHSNTPGDDCGMTLEGTVAYREEMAELKKKYSGKIRVLCGLERDFYSVDHLEYDYVIGSVHFVRFPDGSQVHVDWTADIQRNEVETVLGGDWYAFAEAYYERVSQVVEVTKCDIIGHFDLLSKFWEQDPMFDPDHPRYVRAWQKAADILMKTGKPFEINTGAMSRGYRTSPYPSADIRKYILSGGGKLILSSDAHQKDNIGYAFNRYMNEIPKGLREPKDNKCQMGDPWIL